MTLREVDLFVTQVIITLTIFNVTYTNVLTLKPESLIPNDTMEVN